MWRYIVLATLIIFGLIYAAPNLYGEDPAIQVTPKNSASLPVNMQQQILAALRMQNIPVLNAKTQDNAVLIRFASTETQLKAQDVIQATLGPNYSVALNLAPNTPKWLRALGAEPMKLGLDLRGGIHFLLQVDTKAMLKERINSDLRSIGMTLRNKAIRYASLSQQGETGFIIRFRTQQEQQAAEAALASEFQNYTFSTSSAGGMYQLSANLTQDALTQLEQYAIDQNLQILRNRVNELGVSEPVIQQQGKNQISVDLPGIQDTARAKEMIGKVATVKFMMVDVEHSAAEAARTGIVPFGDILVRTTEGQPILLKNQVVLHGSSILNASATYGDDGRPAVNVTAGGSDLAMFNRITAENINKPMATVYSETIPIKRFMDKKIVTEFRQKTTVISVANIQSALGANFQIMGLESMLYAQNLALQLRSGSYSAPVNFVQERLVGPSLGRENIRLGVMSTLIASIAVIVFMLFYYHLFGLVADMALILNVVFVVAVMSLLGATMTLPGIAGIVLTVGMAVDANVLINERIREELRHGNSPHASIAAGYDRAFMTIVDANVTTLIVALVLFALGTGPVQSFAITLTIGLITSMITAIFFTRAVVNLVYGRRAIKHLSIGIRLQKVEAQ